MVSDRHCRSLRIAIRIQPVCSGSAWFLNVSGTEESHVNIESSFLFIHIRQVTHARLVSSWLLLILVVEYKVLLVQTTTPHRRHRQSKLWNVEGSHDEGGALRTLSLLTP